MRRSFTFSGILHDYPLKLLAVVLSLLLWLHVATEKRYEREARLAVRKLIIGGSLALAQAPPDSLSVLVSATGKTLWRTDWRDEGLILRLDGLSAGIVERALTPTTVALVRGEDVRLEAVTSPRSHSFVVEPLLERTVPVNCRAAVEAATGFAPTAGVSVYPETATVRGPRSTVNAIRSVSTEERVFRNVAGSYDTRLRLRVDSLYGVTVDPPEVIYRISVAPLIERVFENVPLVVSHARPDALRVTPRFVTLRLAGPDADMRRMTLGDVVASVDAQRADSLGRVSVRVALARHIRLLSLSDSVASLSPSAGAAQTFPR